MLTKRGGGGGRQDRLADCELEKVAWSETEMVCPCACWLPQYQGHTVMCFETEFWRDVHATLRDMNMACCFERVAAPWPCRCWLTEHGPFQHGPVYLSLCVTSSTLYSLVTSTTCTVQAILDVCAVSPRVHGGY